MVPSDPVDLGHAIREAGCSHAPDPRVRDAVVAAAGRRPADGFVDGGNDELAEVVAPDVHRSAHEGLLGDAAHRVAVGVDRVGDVAAGTSQVVHAARARAVRDRDPVAAAQRGGAETRVVPHDVHRRPGGRLTARGARRDQPAEDDEGDRDEPGPTDHAHTIRPCASSPSGSWQGCSPPSSGSAAASSWFPCSSSSPASPSGLRRRRRSWRSRSRRRPASSCSGCGVRSRSATRRS